ncbi:Alpha/Beta hydrolase protein [Podospora australis]|uniref:Alpha/Beta hydrolase protein n=1 Tax=Podospora australis TaxID=1536484 RepID=A0AAN6WN04_9PEZI|nr:Alpha/Beta hydrolase protein [Podospora australis]
MPSYEPTPRRFSVISVSQTASRRNSIDDPARQSLVQNHAVDPSQETSVDLSAVLKQLQHVEHDEQRQRGRSVGPRAVWGQVREEATASAIRAPSARRERNSSPSTKERISLWEEKGRSLSRHGAAEREKSRGRSRSRVLFESATAGNRVSVVPEIPELTAAFKKFENGEKMGTEDRNASTEQTARPQTPTRTDRGAFLTPETTPKQNQQTTTDPSSRSDHWDSDAEQEIRAKLRTPSPSTRVPKSLGLPLTPDATPQRKQRDEVPPNHTKANVTQNNPDQTVWQEGSKLQKAQEHQPEQYHQVWKISPYEPETPRPKRSSQHPEVSTGFRGNPLQQLALSQFSEATSYQHPSPSPSPYPYYNTNRHQGNGDWVVNIPPAPATTYAPPTHIPDRPKKPKRNLTEVEGRYTSRSAPKYHEWDAPPVIERALHAASVGVVKGLELPVELYRGFRDVYYPPPNRPDIIKAYPVRKRLPIRIFFPSHHDLTSPALLPTIFTIHGGAFTVGSPADDDAWNRTFSDSYTILVIALNYSKAPWAPFPGPLADVEALYHAVLNDESLPIDRMRTALSGFDAGANLALGLSQLPSVKTGRDPNVHRFPPPYFHETSHPRSNPPPAAVIPICGILDFTVSVAQKARTRPYKKQLRGPRGWGPGLDWMARLLSSSAWSYIPYGHDAADPLLSPVYAPRGELPPHVFVIAAELNCLAHESWRAACQWAGYRAVPDREEVVGRKAPSLWKGCLDDGRTDTGGRFGWTEQGQGESTKWLLVPDVVHGFDSAGWRNKYLWGDEEAKMDAEMKTIAYQREMAEWLWNVVWR